MKRLSYWLSFVVGCVIYQAIWGHNTWDAFTAAYWAGIVLGGETIQERFL